MNSYNSLEPQLFYYLVYQKQNYSTSYGLKVGRGGASSQFHHKTRNIMFNNLYCGTPGGEVYCISRGLDRETEGAWINVGDASSFLGCGMSQSPKGGCNGIYTHKRAPLLQTLYPSSICSCYSCFAQVSVLHCSLWNTSKQAESRHLLLPDKKSSAWGQCLPWQPPYRDDGSAWSKTSGALKGSSKNIYGLLRLCPWRKPGQG